MNITFQGIWRMDWGFGNPNLTAGLLVSLLCVVWLPAFFFRRGFWFCLPFGAAIGVCLIHTMSRGGILGGILAMAVLAALVPRPWPVKRLVGVGCAVWIAILAMYFLNAYQRIGQGIATEDKSITHRLQIWKAAPEMLAVQPMGWGWNQAGRAYADWFQPVGRTESYGSLVNTHLTKVVELGILGGSAYLFVWLASLLLCWPSKNSPWRAIPFALIVGFGIAATFTNMARHWELWVLPAISIAAVIIDRIRCRQSPSQLLLAGALLLSILPPSAMYLMGKMSSDMPLRIDNQIVTIGRGDPSLWILADEGLLGDNFRRKLREYVVKRADLSICLVEKPEHLPASLNKPLFVLSKVDASQAMDITSRGAKTLFLSPNFSPSELTDSNSVVAIYGEFSKSKQLGEWLQIPSTIKLQGIGDFIPDWPERLFEVGGGKGF